MIGAGPVAGGWTGQIWYSILGRFVRSITHPKTCPPGSNSGRSTGTPTYCTAFRYTVQYRSYCTGKAKYTVLNGVFISSMYKQHKFATVESCPRKDAPTPTPRSLRTEPRRRLHSLIDLSSLCCVSSLWRKFRYTLPHLSFYSFSLRVW